MGRRALGIGDHGTITASLQRRDDSGRWRTGELVKTGRSRAARWTFPAELKNAPERWRVRTYVGGHDGIRRELNGYGQTKAEAEASIQDQLERLKGSDAGMHAATPLKDAGGIWLDHLKRPSKKPKSPKTIELYEGALGRYVLGAGSPVRGLTVGQLNDAPRIRGLLQHVADHHGAGAAKVTRTVVSSILQLAVDDRVLDHNMARGVKPAVASAEKVATLDHDRAFTRTELDAVIHHADLMAGLVEPVGDDPAPTPGNGRTMRARVAVADLLAFLSGTGVRIDEARSVEWSDVDLDAGTVEVKGTKTKTSHRMLNMPSWLCDRLRRRADDYGIDGYVFFAPSLTTTTTTWDRRNSHRAVRDTLDAAGFPWASAHSFRRSVATELHRQGAPLVRISDQLGHARPTMTADRYLGRDLRGDKADLAALL